jgi:hypothetical protein
MFVYDEKAEQLTDIMKELGQPGASENNGSRILQNDQVELSPQSMLQGGDDQNTALQDCNDEPTKYMETSIYRIGSPNVEDHDLMVVRGTDITSQGKQNSDVQYHNGVSCVDKGISCCGNNPEEQDDDLADIKLCKDGLGVNSENIEEISYKGATNNNYSSENQEIKSIDYTNTHIDTLDCENLQLEDLEGPSVNAREQDQDLESISHDGLNHNCGHSANISSKMSFPKTHNVIVDQVETQNVMMIPSNSSSLLLKSSGEQMHVEDFLHLNGQVAKGEKNRWQLAGPLQSHYHHPENINNGSGNLQITQPYLSSGQQSSSGYLDNGVLSQQQDQLATSAFIVDNPSSVIEPFSNLQSNGTLHMAKDIGAVSYSLQHANSIEPGLHSLVNNRLAQSAPFPRSLQEQQQLTDQSDNCLYGQLHKDYCADVSFPTKVNPPISEQHSYAAFGSMDHRYNWFPDGCQLHNNNNMPGLESGNCLTQALPSGSNTDGTLFSAISQYKQPSVHLGHGGSSRSQVLEPRNQVRPLQNFLPRSQDTNPPFSDMYGYTQDMASHTSSQIAPVSSMDGSHWTNFIQQNPAMAPDFTNRPFRGPWTR